MKKLVLSLLLTAQSSFALSPAPKIFKHTQEGHGSLSNLHSYISYLNGTDANISFGESVKYGQLSIVSTALPDADIDDFDAYSYELTYFNAFNMEANEKSFTIKGKLAKDILRGMWLKNMDYPENFSVDRGYHFSTITIQEGPVTCSKKYNRHNGMFYSCKFRK